MQLVSVWQVEVAQAGHLAGAVGDVTVQRFLHLVQSLGRGQRRFVGQTGQHMRDLAFQRCALECEVAGAPG